MPETNFIQIHSLHGYSAALLNRDDSGLAKRMPYGGHTRTRISSQCLKRHWRTADDDHALPTIDGATEAIRSREIVSREIVDRLKKAGHDTDIVDAVSDELQMAVYGDKGAARESRQPLLLGKPEIHYLYEQARELVEGAASVEAATKDAQNWRKEATRNLNAMREACQLPGGLVAAMFGRMVTSDVEANIDAAIHVAHAFTVHEEESESDYFTVVDDLHRIEDDAGADHIGEAELTSGLFYGYVVIDRRTLLANLGNDEDMAAEVTRCLVHLIATVSPGAKLGSTAPYDFASWLLVEAGNRQPRSLAEAFRTPCRPLVEDAEAAISGHIERLDAAYGIAEERRAMSLAGSSVPGAELVSVDGLADWAGTSMRSRAE